jgi:nucleotide-binding universal stress UspA family protein
MKIVVGVDGSDSSLVAARAALRHAEAFGAEVHAVHVAQVAATVVAAMGAFPVPAVEITDAERTEVWRRLASVLDDTSVRVTRVDLDGYPPDELVDYAAEQDADLLVVGSRGRGDLASLVLGSVSHRVVNHAPCDVLVARKEPT